MFYLHLFKINNVKHFTQEPTQHPQFIRVRNKGMFLQTVIYIHQEMCNNPVFTFQFHRTPPFSDEPGDQAEQISTNDETTRKQSGEGGRELVTSSPQCPTGAARPEPPGQP